MTARPRTAPTPMTLKNAATRKGHGDLQKATRIKAMIGRKTIPKNWKRQMRARNVFVESAAKPRPDVNQKSLIPIWRENCIHNICTTAEPANRPSHMNSLRHTPLRENKRLESVPSRRDLTMSLKYETGIKPVDAAGRFSRGSLRLDFGCFPVSSATVHSLAASYVSEQNLISFGLKTNEFLLTSRIRRVPACVTRGSW